MVILVAKCYVIFQVPGKAWFANTLIKMASVDMLVCLPVSKAASDLPQSQSFSARVADAVSLIYAVCLQFPNYMIMCRGHTRLNLEASLLILLLAILERPAICFNSHISVQNWSLCFLFEGPTWSPRAVGAGFTMWWCRAFRTVLWSTWHCWIPLSWWLVVWCSLIATI